MLSSVLNSPTAIKVNIQIIRVFTEMREMLTDSFNLKVEIEDIKRKISSQDKNIGLVFGYLDELLGKRESKKPRQRIGYK